MVREGSLELAAARILASLLPGGEGQDEGRFLCIIRDFRVLSKPRELLLRF
jgi:hypothetical protein